MIIAFLDSYVTETLWFSQSQWNSETVVLGSVLKDQQKKKWHYMNLKFIELLQKS